MARSVDDYLVGCICALEVELAAFQACMDEIHEPVIITDGDDNAYTFGRVGLHNVVVACLGITGKVSAANVAANMARTFTSMKFALMVGIGGGAWSEKVDVRLGDIVVGAAGPLPGVIQYDYGKTAQGKGLVQRGSLQKAPSRLLNAVTALRAKHRLGKFGFIDQIQRLSQHESEYIAAIACRPEIGKDRLFESDYIHPPDAATCDACEASRIADRKARKNEKPQVHYGVIASGDQVMKDAIMRDRIMMEHDIICFEMEAAGLMDIFPSLAIRGISDYSDSHKNDEWQPYAATVAAAYAAELLANVAPFHKGDVPSVGETMQASESQPVKTTEAASKHESRKQFSPVTIMPFARDANFVGRKTHLRNIDDAAARGATRIALHGLGGVGKTQIAVEYAYHYRQEHPASPIFWIHASGSERVVEGCTDIARRLKLPGHDDPTGDMTRCFSDYVAECERDWLLIVDNVDDAAFVEGSDSGDLPSDHDPLTLTEFLSRFNNGRILITSRNMIAADKLVGDPDCLFEIGPLHLDEAVELLRKKMPLDRKNESNLEDLVIELDRIPLAIIQAAAYMRQNRRVTVSRYLDLFRSSPTDRELLLKFRNADPRRDRKASNAILTTWQLSFTQIEAENPTSTKLLSILSMFDRQKIPDYLVSLDALRECTTVDFSEVSGIELDESISLLLGFSFITQGVDGETFDMHRLVQVATKAWLGSGSMFKDAALSILNNEYPFLPSTPSDWAICAALEPHIAATTEEISVDLYISAILARLLHNRAHYYTEARSRYIDAAKMAEVAAKYGDQAFGEWSMESLDALKLRCYSFMRAGDYKMAIKVGMESLNSCVGMPLDEQQLSVLRGTRYWVASAYEASEQLEMALKVIQFTTEELKQHHGMDSSEFLVSTRFHSELLFRLGRPREAQEIQDLIMRVTEEDIKSGKCKFGLENERTLNAMNDLGLLHEQRNELHEAKAVYVEIYEVRKRSLGLDNLSTLDSLTRLGIAHRELGELDEAEVMLAEVLERRRRILGADNSVTRDSILILGHLYLQSGKLDKARTLLYEAWELNTSIFGPEHDSTANVLADLAEIESKTGNFTKSEKLWEEVVRVWINTRGPLHNATLRARTDWALDMDKHGRTEDAYRAMLEIYNVAVEAFGVKHLRARRAHFWLLEWSNEFPHLYDRFSPRLALDEVSSDTESEPGRCSDEDGRSETTLAGDEEESAKMQIFTSVSEVTPIPGTGHLPDMIHLRTFPPSHLNLLTSFNLRSTNSQAGTSSMEASWSPSSVD